MADKQICSWCGKANSTVVKPDASGDMHWFHIVCWRKHVEFLGAGRYEDFEETERDKTADRSSGKVAKP